MCLNTHHTHMHIIYTYLHHAIRVDHIYIVLTKYDVGEDQIATPINNKSEIVEGVCDTERREKMPP